MFKQKLCIELEGAEGRKYSLHCEPNAPLGELYDVLYKMKAAIMHQLNESHKKDKLEKECDQEECKEEGEDEAKS